MNFNKSEIHLIAECRRICNCTEPPFLNTSVFANVPKQEKKTKPINMFISFDLHANLNVCFKFTFNRIFRKVKKYSIISILLNKPFSFALYMLCIIWVHVKEADWTILPSVAPARGQHILQKKSLHEKTRVPVTPRCIFYQFIRLIWSSDDRW